jgi:hypothetical protein
MAAVMVSMAGRLPRPKLLQPPLLEGDQRMRNIFLFHHGDASFDR